MVGKGGQGFKYDILISVILGLLVVGLSLYFIFQEYFTEDDADWEICRQSVVLRDKAIRGTNTWELQWLAENFPFKCRAELIEINYKDYDKAGFEIADAMASCKALYGDKRLYSSDVVVGDIACFQCSRIHFTEDVRDFYSPVEYNRPSDEIQKLYDDLKRHYADYSGLLSYYNSEFTYLGYPLNILDVGEHKKNLESSLSLAKKEMEEEESPDELARLSEYISDLEREINLLNEISLAYNDYLELGLFLLKHPNNLYSKTFHWATYLLKKMKNVDMTYDEFIYGDKDGKILIGFKDLVEYEPVFDARKGDLIISYRYAQRSITSKPTATVIPHQTNQQLDCDVYETIPA